jgi:hypothetical protein
MEIRVFFHLEWERMERRWCKETSLGGLGSTGKEAIKEKERKRKT